MNKKHLSRIQTRSMIIHMIVTLMFIFGVIASCAAAIALIYLFFKTPDNFSAVKEGMNWSLRYGIGNGAYFLVDVPTKNLQAFDGSIDSAKNAFITAYISLLILTSIILYGIKQVAKVLKSTIKDDTPFMLKNAKSLKRLAYATIVYSAAGELLKAVLNAVFVTQVFSFDLTSIHLSGIVVGVLIFIVADVFQYGIFLQNEFDTTL